MHKVLHVVKESRFCSKGGVAGSLQTSSLKVGGLLIRVAHILPSYNLLAYTACPLYSNLKRLAADRFSLLRVLGYSGFPP